jgi:pSer/pThr/pTyr-binding forkhead associated (FHA) protein
MDVRIKFLFGPLSGQTVRLAAGELVIGRDKDCGFGPMSDFVSRQHCVLSIAENALTIRDLGSKNGTFVNGSRVGNVTTGLPHGAIVSVGDFVFQIDLEAAAPIEPITALPNAGSGGTTADMAGTGVFDGETIDSANPNRTPPPAPTPTPTSELSKQSPVEADPAQPSS